MVSLVLDLVYGFPFQTADQLASFFIHSQFFPNRAIMRTRKLFPGLIQNVQWPMEVLVLRRIESATAPPSPSACSPTN